MKNIMIVLNYNDYLTTKVYMQMIQNYEILDKIIIVDNNSTDDSYENLKELSNNKIDVIKTNDNKGYAYGNNYGIIYAENKYNPTNIIISNPDIIVAEESIIRIIEVLESHKEIAVATGIIHSSKGKIISNFAWKVPTYRDMIINCFFLLYKFNRTVLKKGIFYNYKILSNKDIVNVEVVSGCFFIIKAKILKEVERLDERTFLFNEENILGYKLKKKGYKECIATNAHVIHNTSTSINKNIKSSARKEKILEESNMVYLKNYITNNNIKILIYKIFYNIGRYEKRVIKLLLNLKQLRKENKNG